MHTDILTACRDLMRHDIFRRFDKKDPAYIETHLLPDTPDPPKKRTYQFHVIILSVQCIRSNAEEVSAIKSNCTRTRVAINYRGGGEKHRTTE